MDDRIKKCENFASFDLIGPNRKLFFFGIVYYAIIGLAKCSHFLSSRPTTYGIKHSLCCRCLPWKVNDHFKSDWSLPQVAWTLQKLYYNLNFEFVLAFCMFFGLERAALGVLKMHSAFCNISLNPNWAAVLRNIWTKLGRKTTRSYKRITVQSIKSI